MIVIRLINSQSWFMALAKRIIPCLDNDNRHVVKSIKFEKNCDAGDLVEME